MIKNEVQYKLTKTSVEGFETRLNWLRANTDVRADLDPIIANAEEVSLESMIEELRDELQEYERTKQGHVDMTTLHSMHMVPAALIKARIAKGLTQRQLANRVGLKEQQIQRYESNDYRNVDFGRVQEIAQALIGSEHEERGATATPRR